MESAPMKALASPIVFLSLFALCLIACSERVPDTLNSDSEAQREAKAGDVTTLDYPSTKKVDVADDYHGTEVADPYRWLERDARESAQVASWVAAQSAVTDAYLETLPMRDWFDTRLAALWDYERFSLPVKRGGMYFHFRNDGMQNQALLYVRRGLDGEPRVLIDPNQWSDDGTVSLAQWVPSPDGRLLAYGVQDGGSDWRTWRVVDVETGELLDDELEWLKFSSIAWDGAGEGFYYSRYPAPDSEGKFQSLNIDMKVFYHRVGDAQVDDRLVYERPDKPEWSFLPEVSDDGRFLVITIFHGTDDRYQVAWKDLAAPESGVRMLIEGFKHDFTFVGNRERTFLFLTNFEAPRYRVVAVELDSPESREVIIPEAESVLQGVSDFGGHLVANYLEDVSSSVKVHTAAGEFVREVDLPGIGTASGFTGKAGDQETFFQFSSFNRPATIYRLDVVSGDRSVWQQPEADFDPEAYTVRQVFFASADGTRIPMFIAHRKDVTPDGTTPTLLYGYGGFNISLTPSFSVPNLAWMEAGGVYAMANLRGGGEYGREWHKAGTRTRKQNGFDDFIAAGEYLIDNGITAPEHLGIHGRSNGGLLVGAVTNQRPALFAAALPAVGVMDMLRFDQFTAGRFWVDDYGSPGNPEEFPALYAYSPYHNVASGEDYPAVLVTTADTDDRVVPGHSFKYAAALQAADTGSEPKLIRIETRAGHGAGTPVQMLIDLYADQWAFLAEHTGLAVEQVGVASGAVGVASRTLEVP